MIEMASTLRLHFLLRPGGREKNLGRCFQNIPLETGLVAFAKRGLDRILTNSCRAGDFVRVSRPARSS